MVEGVDLENQYVTTSWVRIPPCPYFMCLKISSMFDFKVLISRLVELVNTSVSKSVSERIVGSTPTAGSIFQSQLPFYFLGGIVQLDRTCVLHT